MTKAIEKPVTVDMWVHSRSVSLQFSTGKPGFGAKLQSVPQGVFLATVPITKAALRLISIRNIYTYSLHVACSTIAARNNADIFVGLLNHRVFFMSISVEILRCCMLGADIFLICFGQIGFNFLQITYQIAFLQIAGTFLFIFAVASESLVLRCLVEMLSSMFIWLADAAGCCTSAPLECDQDSCCPSCNVLHK